MRREPVYGFVRDILRRSSRPAIGREARNARFILGRQKDAGNDSQ